MRKGHETTAQYAIQDLVLDLLPELDNFERAAKLAENSKDIDKFVEGVKLIEGQLFKVLEKYGVKSIETVGKPFDPSLHEAVVEEENNELSHHTVIEEFQRGFLLKERVIRPSKVKVSKRTVDEEKSDETNDDNSES
jgi:molecular chaperone GrpE